MEALSCKEKQKPLGNPPNAGGNVFWSNEIKCELFGQKARHYTSFCHKNAIHTVKHDDGSIVLWGWKSFHSQDNYNWIAMFVS